MDLELAEKLVAAKLAGLREANELRLEEMRRCIQATKTGWGVADWDDVRDFIHFAGQALAEKREREED